MRKLIKKYKILFLAIIVTLAGVLYVHFGSDSEVISDIEETTSQAKKSISVYVSGAVNLPGVYMLKDGSRICDVIELAGGILEDAYIDNINMAASLSDGQRVNIITISEYEMIKEEERSLVNINEAGKEKLMTLPGIGSAKAEAIVKYRQENGRFENIEDIMKVSGIKKAAFDKIKDLIIV